MKKLIAAIVTLIATTKTNLVSMATETVTVEGGDGPYRRWSSEQVQISARTVWRNLCSSTERLVGPGTVTTTFRWFVTAFVVMGAIWLIYYLKTGSMPMSAVPLAGISAEAPVHHLSWAILPPITNLLLGPMFLALMAGGISMICRTEGTFIGVVLTTLGGLSLGFSLLAGSMSIAFIVVVLAFIGFALFIVALLLLILGIVKLHELETPTAGFFTNRPWITAGIKAAAAGFYNYTIKPIVRLVCWISNGK